MEDTKSIDSDEDDDSDDDSDDDKSDSDIFFDETDSAKTEIEHKDEDSESDNDLDVESSEQKELGKQSGSQEVDELQTRVSVTTGITKQKKLYIKKYVGTSSDQSLDEYIYVNPVSYFKCNDLDTNPLLNTTFVDKYGSTIKSAYVLKNKDVVVLFFSYSNCGRGANVLEILKEIHKKAELHKKKFEVVYVSYDYTKEEMMYDLRVNHGNWFGIDYDDPLREALRHFYGVLAVPQLIVIDAFGETITRTGVEEVEDIGINVLVTWF